MIIFTGEIRVSPENQAAFESKLRAYCCKIRDDEPGTIFYEGSKGTQDPDRYIVIEVYRDMAAIEAHTNTDAFKLAMAEIPPLTIETVVTKYETFSNI